MPITLRFNPERQQQASAAAFGVGMPITDGGASAVAGGLQRVASAAGQIGARLEQKDNELEHRKLTDASSRREAELDSLVELRKEAFDNGEMQVLRDLNEKIAEFNPDSETYSKNLNTYVNSDKYSALRDESLELGDASFRERHAATFERGGVMSRSLESINQMEDDGDSILAPLEKAIKEDSASAGTVAAMEATFQSLMAHPTYANNPKKAEYLEARYNVGLIAAAESFNDRAAELPYEQAQAQAADIEKKIRASSINGPEKQKVLSRLDEISAPKGDSYVVKSQLRGMQVSTKANLKNLTPDEWLNYSRAQVVSLDAIITNKNLSEGIRGEALSHKRLLEVADLLQVDEDLRIGIQQANPTQIQTFLDSHKLNELESTHYTALTGYIQGIQEQFKEAQGNAYLETISRNPRIGSRSATEEYNTANNKFKGVLRSISRKEPADVKVLKEVKASKQALDTLVRSPRNANILGSGRTTAKYDMPFVEAITDSLSSDGDLQHASAYLQAWAEVTSVSDVTNWAAANLGHKDEDIRATAHIAAAEYRGTEADPTATPLMKSPVLADALMRESETDTLYENNSTYDSVLTAVGKDFTDEKIMPKTAERISLTSAISSEDALFFYAAADALAKDAFRAGIKDVEKITEYVEQHIDNSAIVLDLENTSRMMVPREAVAGTPYDKMLSGRPNKKVLARRLGDVVNEGFRTLFSTPTDMPVFHARRTPSLNGDGDSFPVQTADGESLEIRLFGVDSPEYMEGEKVNPLGLAAAEFTRNILGTSEFKITSGGKGHYGRTLASVEILSGPYSGKNLADVLVEAGHAERTEDLKNMGMIQPSTYEFQDTYSDNRLYKEFNERMRKFQSGESHIDDVLNLTDKFGEPYAVLGLAIIDKKQVITVFVNEYGPDGNFIKRAPWKATDGRELYLDAGVVFEEAFHSKEPTSKAAREYKEMMEQTRGMIHSGLIQ